MVADTRYGWMWSPYDMLFFYVIMNTRKWAKMQWNREKTVDGLRTSNEMMHIGL
jgi:hypothetical protein